MYIYIKKILTIKSATINANCAVASNHSKLASRLDLLRLPQCHTCGHINLKLNPNLNPVLSLGSSSLWRMN